jgi:hypothetical protein
MMCWQAIQAFRISSSLPDQSDFADVRTIMMHVRHAIMGTAWREGREPGQAGGHGGVSVRCLKTSMQGARRHHQCDGRPDLTLAEVSRRQNIYAPHTKTPTSSSAPSSTEDGEPVEITVMTGFDPAWRRLRPRSRPASPRRSQRLRQRGPGRRRAPQRRRPRRAPGHRPAQHRVHVRSDAGAPARPATTPRRSTPGSARHEGVKSGRK